MVTTSDEEAELDRMREDPNVPLGVYRDRRRQLRSRKAHGGGKNANTTHPSNSKGDGSGTNNANDANNIYVTTKQHQQDLDTLQRQIDELKQQL